jgi:hypothetical protein
MGAECPYDEDPLIKVSASVSKRIAYRIFAAIVTNHPHSGWLEESP